jgi:hypothetical protein
VLAHRIALLQDGALILLGPPQDLLRSDHPEARAFAAGIRGAPESPSGA